MTMPSKWQDMYFYEPSQVHPKIDWCWADRESAIV